MWTRTPLRPERVWHGTLGRDPGVQKKREIECKICMEATRSVLESAAGSWASRCQVVTPNGRVWSVLDGDKIRVLHDGRYRTGVVVDKSTSTYYRTLQIACRHLGGALKRS